MFFLCCISAFLGYFRVIFGMRVVQKVFPRGDFVAQAELEAGFRGCFCGFSA
jgi:hypothetical protein